MQAVEPGPLVALKVWWALFWRSITLAVGLMMVAGVLTGLGYVLVGGRGERVAGAVSAAMGIVSVPAFIAASIKATEWTLRKKFGDFEIAVVPRQD